MLLNKNIKNLLGGVSKQPWKNRFDNQVEVCDNFTVTVTDGLRRRNPVEDIASVAVQFTDESAIHSYDRGDGLEKYGIVIDNAGCRVYDADGNQKTVNTGLYNPVDTWTGTNWKKDLQFLTVGDTTWILNKSITVTATLQNDTVEENKAFYWINKSTEIRYGENASSARGYDYQIVLDGVAYTTNSTSTIIAASNLYSQVVSAGYSAKRVGSILKIWRSTPFTFASGDSFGNQASFGWRDNVQKLTDLPADMQTFTEAEVGTIAVTGTDRDNYNNYYLKWDTDHWTETYRPETKLTLAGASLPAVLRREADGTFTFDFIDEWKPREKGDEDSNPTPSFVNNKISNIFFFKNRLGFTSNDNVILSESGEYYNFFATTVMELLDTDPIDVTIDSNTVSTIRNVTASSGALTLWADNVQFLLAGGEILSPATTRVSQTSSYSCDNSLRPIVLDNEVMFFNKIGSRLDVLSYSPASLQADKSSAISLSSHVSNYLPSSISRVVASSANNMVFFLDPESNDIYVYRYFVAGEQRVISAWFRWTFQFTINNIEVLDNELFVLSGSKIGKISLDEKPITDNDFVDFGLYSYTSIVELSKFNIEASEKSKDMRYSFFTKTILVDFDGEIEVTVFDKTRSSARTAPFKYAKNRIFVGGDTDKMKITFSSTSNKGCRIDGVNILGQYAPKSKNI